jgi:hypothetical protein
MAGQRISRHAFPVILRFKSLTGIRIVKKPAVVKFMAGLAGIEVNYSLVLNSK